jgi:hypothetical protein
MKAAGVCLSLCAGFASVVYADLTIVQRVEGAGPATEMTIKIKGEKARIDATPDLSTIIDGKTGEMINLMKDQKKVVRISPEKMKAAVDMVNKYEADDKKGATAKPKLVPTGKKEKLNGYDTEEYLCETPAYKATYSVAPGYPDGAAILKQLQSLNPQVWTGNNMSVPDYRDFAGVPIRTVISMNGSQITTTLTSIKQDPVADSEFLVPKDFQEMKVPDIGKLMQDPDKAPAANPTP